MSLRLLVITVISMVSYSSFAQQEKRVQDYFKQDTIFENNKVFDFFRQENDSIVYVIGRCFLMPSDSISFTKKNKYKHIIQKSDDKRKIYGSYRITYKNELLYEYQLANGIMNGLGYIYYPFINKVAIQAQFRNNLIHGFVIVQDREGKTIEIMKYKNGVYKKHCFFWDRANVKRFKIESRNPLRNDFSITI